MKRFLIGVLSVFLALNGYAAPDLSGVVKGKVIDSKSKEALEFVNVSIKKKGSDQIVKGATTDLEGNFIIGNLQPGTYVVNVSYIGYTPYEKEFTISPNQKSVSLRMIPLAEDSQMLGEVQVVGQKPQMRFDIDKKVFNVDQNIASSGGSASDVLSNIPSVDVDNEGEVSLRGNSSVTIWINGKASGLSADNRAEILEQMPAESIENIEVITNPSAKYSPEGTAGIINIVLKEDRKAGYYGSAQAGADTDGGYNASANINYSSGKVEAYANLGYRERRMKGGGYTDRLNIRETDTTFLDQTSSSKNNGGNVFARLGMTWNVTSKDHLTLGGFGMFGSRTGKNRIDYLSNTPGSFVSSLRTSDSDNDMNGGNIELGYKHDFSKKSNLDLTASWNSWGMDNHTVYNQFSDYADGEETTSYQRQLNNIRNHNWEFQADYVNSFDDRNKLEAGYKGTLSRQNSPVETYSGTAESNAEADENLFNRFLYNQDIHALYATYSTKFGPLGLQAGLRGEYSKVETKSLAYGQTQTEVSPYKRDYFSLFPSVFLSYSLPRDNEIQVNYTRRISRPWGGQLNSFMNITDSTNISFGNPRLSPQYSNAFELNYIKNWGEHLLSFSGYYRNTNDVIQRIRFLEGDIMKSTYENVAKTQSAGVEIVGKDKLFRILDLTTTVNLFYSKLDGFTYQPAGVVEPVVGKAEENFSWNARMIANLMLPYGISLQMTGNYNAKQVVAQGYRKPNYSLDAGLRKSFLDKKLSLSINARDLLDSRKRHTITSGTGFEQDDMNWRGGRRFGFTLTYSFGNMRAQKSKPQRQMNMNEDPSESMENQ